MDVNLNKVSDMQEFFIALEKKDAEGKFMTFNKEFTETPCTLLLSEISLIYKIHVDDWAFPGLEETRVILKSGAIYDLLVKYEEIRKDWKRFLTQ